MRAKRATLIFNLVSKWRQIKKLYHFFWLAFLPIWCPLKGEPRPPWIIGSDFRGQIKQILMVIIHVAYCHDYHSSKKGGLSWFMVLAWLQYCGLYQGQIRLCFFLTSSVTTLATDYCCSDSTFAFCTNNQLRILRILLLDYFDYSSNMFQGQICGLQQKDLVSCT